MPRIKLTKAELQQRKSEQRAIKYATIVNTWGSDDLARRYRDKSWESIQYDLGIKPVAKAPKIKKYTDDQKKKRLSKLDNYQSNYNKIVTSNPEVDTIKLRELTQKNYKKETLLKRYKVLTDRDIRNNYWSKWSSENDLPPQLKYLARRLNKLAKKRRNNHYGYIITYNAYVNNSYFGDYVENYKQVGYTSEEYIFTSRR